jgi:hypothetical protein
MSGFVDDAGRFFVFLGLVLCANFAVSRRLSLVERGRAEPF